MTQEQVRFFFFSLSGESSHDDDTGASVGDALGLSDGNEVDSRKGMALGNELGADVSAEPQLE